MLDYYLLKREYRELPTDEFETDIILVRANNDSEIRDYCTKERESCNRCGYEIQYSWTRVCEYTNFVDVRR